MAQSKSTQFKRQKRFLGETWFCAIVIFIASLLFSITAINHAYTLEHWTTSGTAKYTGGYSFSKYHYLRNTHYRFSLNNGDIISVPSEQIQQIDNISEYTILSFKYCRIKSIFRFGTHDGIEIKLPEEESYILHGEITRKALQKEMVLYAALGIACLFLLVLFAAFLFYPSNKAKNKQKNSKALSSCTKKERDRRRHEERR